MSLQKKKEEEEEEILYIIRLATEIAFKINTLIYFIRFYKFIYKCQNVLFISPSIVENVQSRNLYKVKFQIKIFNITWPISDII